MTDAAIKSLVPRLESVAGRLEAVEKQLASGPAPATTTRSSGGGAPAGGASSRGVAAFDDTMHLIDEYVTLSGKIDPLVKQHADLVKQAVGAHRELLSTAAQSKKPSDSVLGQLVKPTADLVAKIIELRDKNRSHANWNHLSTISEGVSCFGWIAAAPTPGPFVDESRASSEFWSNKILVQYRKDESATGKLHVDWVKAWNGWMHALRDVIKQHYTTGLTWTGQGDASSAASTSTTPSGGAPPPPGPPPPVVPLDTGAADKQTNAAAALFAEINKVKDRQTGGRTEGLRKVTADMKTKNQKDRAPAVVPSSSGSQPKSTPAKAGSAPARPPKFLWKPTNGLLNTKTATKTS